MADEPQKKDDDATKETEIKDLADEELDGVSGGLMADGTTFECGPSGGCKALKITTSALLRASSGSTRPGEGSAAFRSARYRPAAKEAACAVSSAESF
jgi:hypothetical protein